MFTVLVGVACFVRSIVYWDKEGVDTGQIRSYFCLSLHLASASSASEDFLDFALYKCSHYITLHYILFLSRWEAIHTYIVVLFLLRFLAYIHANIHATDFSVRVCWHSISLRVFTQQCHSGLVVTCLTAVWEDPGSNLTAGGCVYHDSHCDIQPWARAAHPYCSA